MRPSEEWEGSPREGPKSLNVQLRQRTCCPLYPTPCSSLALQEVGLVIIVLFTGLRKKLLQVGAEGEGRHLGVCPQFSGAPFQRSSLIFKDRVLSAGNALTCFWLTHDVLPRAKYYGYRRDAGPASCCQESLTRGWLGLGRLF